MVVVYNKHVSCLDLFHTFTAKQMFPVVRVHLYLYVFDSQSSGIPVCIGIGTETASVWLLAVNILIPSQQWNIHYNKKESASDTMVHVKYS